MTGRSGSMATEGPQTSANDVARMQAEDELHAEWQRKAVRVVAAAAADARDCRLLLSILGLDGDVIAEARRAGTRRADSKPARKRSARAA